MHKRDPEIGQKAKSASPAVIDYFEVATTDGVSSLTKEEFLEIAKTIEKLYRLAIFEKGGVPLVVEADWSDETVNAFAYREADRWVVQIAGGMARAKFMTKHSLALILCHELGHHLGGAPRSFLYDGWPSAEGQADYWATSKCLKKYYKTLGHDDILKDEIPKKAADSCMKVYRNPTDARVCNLTMRATQHFANFLNGLSNVKYPVSLESSDDRQVKGTNTNDYPRPQCRIDTLFQGALCSISSDVATSDYDDKIGHCNDSSSLGARPRCWFRQTKN